MQKVGADGRNNPNTATSGKPAEECYEGGSFSGIDVLSGEQFFQLIHNDREARHFCRASCGTLQRGVDGCHRVSGVIAKQHPHIARPTGQACQFRQGMLIDESMGQCGAGVRTLGRPHHAVTPQACAIDGARPGDRRQQPRAHQ